MNVLSGKSATLYKELQVSQESPAGTKMIYTCYEAIPNGGFCILSAVPDKGGNIQLKRAIYLKEPNTILNGVEVEFFPTLIEAIAAYSTQETHHAS